MICGKCRKGKHKKCKNVRLRSEATDGLPVVADNWCDCQHVTEGTTINPLLVPVRPQERV